MKFISFLFFFFIIESFFSQNSSETYYNQFDKLVGSYKSDLNTGERFEDLFITNSDNEFRFFMSKESAVGTVNYNSQDYYQSSIKYDLLEDNLVFRNLEGNNQYDVILEKQLVSSFSLLGRDFIKLPSKASKFSFYKNGFFEIVRISNEFNIYLKHEKFKKKRLGDKSIYYTYSTTQTLLLEYQSEFYDITSKNTILKILPERKEAIKLFFKNNENLESQNKIEFMKKLFASLSTIN